MIKQALVTSFAVFVVACGGSAAPTPANPSNTTSAAAATGHKMGPVCHDLHESCEAFEGKGGVAQECHDMAYTATEDACTAKKAECAAACKK